MRNLLIRTMTLDDVLSVCEIEKQSFSDPWGEDSFEFSIKSESDYCIVALDEQAGRVVGYALLRCSFDVADLINIAVDRDYRRHGIGSALVSYLMKFGDTEGITDCFLEVRENNIPAIELYKKMGFEIKGIRKNYYIKPVENALVMRRGG